VGRGGAWLIERPDLFTVHAASVDDASRYAPQVLTYGVRGHAWDHVDSALPKFRRCRRREARPGLALCGSRASLPSGCHDRDEAKARKLIIAQRH
jgi:hypothetical protein